MRGLRSTIALLVVLGGLGAYIYFVTWKQPAETPGPSRRRSSRRSRPTRSTSCRSSRSRATPRALKKDKDGWQIVEPRRRRRRRRPRSSGITSALSQLEIARVVDENPAT